MLREFTVAGNNRREAMGQALDFIWERLNSLGLPRKEVNRARLMAEESLVRLVEHGNFEEGGKIQVNVRRFLGSVTISLAVPGEEIDFLKGFDMGAPFDDGEMTPEAAEAIQNILLRSFEDKIKYQRRRGWNRVRIRAVRSACAPLYWTLAALFLAIVTGLLMKALVPEALCATVDSKLLVPLRTVFMNGLKMCAPVVVFLSIANCVAQFGDLSEIRRLGGRLLLYFVMIQVLSAGIGLGLFALFRPGDSMEIVVSDTVAVQGSPLSLVDSLVSLMPSNFFRPFIESNMLQLIVLAVFFGMAVGAIGAETIRKLLEECGGVFMRITGVLMRFMPLVIFCSIASVILTTGSSTLFLLMGLFCVCLLGCAAVTALCLVLIALLGHLSLLRFLTKSASMFITALSTSSSSATIPDMMGAARKMGVSPKLYSLSLPLGVTLNKPLSIMCTVIVVSALAKAYGVELSMRASVTLALSAMMLYMGMPGMPGGMVIVHSSLLSQIGVPIEGVGLVMGLLAVIDMFITVANCFANMTSTLLVASQENGMLDREVYES